MIQSLGDEMLIFDATANRAHSLNPTAAAVWRACDGTRIPDEIADHCQLDPIAVELALQSLADARLIDGFAPPADRVSRRTAIQRLAISGVALGITLPVIRSIVAPSLAMAGSTAGSYCSSRSDCTHSGSYCHSNCECQDVSCFSGAVLAIGPQQCRDNPCCAGQSCVSIGSLSIDCHLR